MPTPLRMKRINDRIKQVLSVLLISKIDDPRLVGVSVTDVKVDRELDFANIYVLTGWGKVLTGSDCRAESCPRLPEA